MNPTAARLALAALLLVPPFSALAEGRFQRILLPIVFVQEPGAHGTIWKSDVSIWNEADVPVEIFRSECEFRCPHAPECIFVVCEPQSATPPHAAWPEVERLTWSEEVPRNPGALVYVEAEHASTLAASLRLFETTGTGNVHGVEIPVVREVEFATKSQWLPDVPVVFGARTHLRLYGLESPTGDAIVRFRVYSGETDLVLRDSVIRLTGGSFTGKTPITGNYDENEPSYAWVDLSDLTAAEGYARIRVDPVTEGLKFWAMASVTDNGTQQVTIVSPQ